MGKRQKGYNWKARQQSDVKIDKTEQGKIHVDSSLVGIDGEDECNALVLPAKKRKVKIVQEHEETKKVLSKKKRRQLEAVVERRKKRLQRAELLDSLAKVAVDSDLLQQMVSVKDVHNNFSTRLKKKEAGEDLGSPGPSKLNTIKGSDKESLVARPTIKDELQNDSDSSEFETSGSEIEDSSSEDEDMKENRAEDEKDDEEKDEETDEKGEEEMEKDDTVGEECDEGTKTNEKKTKEEAEGKTKTSGSAPTAKTEAPPSRPVVNIPVNRSPEVEATREKLPICSEEQMIMETINENDVVVLCGETGSGKTTQVPQFLYEAGYAHGGGIIGVTEPRRVAAISMSKRVAYEMGLSEKEVSFQIRYEGNVSPETRMKFMTDGVLLKELQEDFMLERYSAVILDEAHERSVFTDILLGLLSRIVPLRAKRGKPLKLIIMSATLRVQDFTENSRLFKTPPPVINVDTRQHEVQVHFNRSTPADYLTEAYRKICKVHRQLPGGGILVFVTGQQEVRTLCKKLRATFPFTTSSAEAAKRKEERGHMTRRQRKRADTQTEDEKVTELPKISLDQYSTLPSDEQAELQGSGDEAGEVRDDKQAGEKDEEKSEEPLFVLPLYSLLPSSKQAKVFDGSPPGSRLCVVATNVAETSLTIPGITYVVDTGKVKTKLYDKVTGVSKFEVAWTSQAAAFQRAGRAGRTGPGHCYRLFSSAVFNDQLVVFSEPEMTRRPVDDLVLQMKAMGIDRVTNFPFPTPPSREAIQTAENVLASMGALDAVKLETKHPRDKKRKPKIETIYRINALGRTLSQLPVSPRFGRLLLAAHERGVTRYAVALVAAMSVQELFLAGLETKVDEDTEELSKEAKKALDRPRRLWAAKGGESQELGDAGMLLRAVGAWEHSGGTPEFAEQHGIRQKAARETRLLRAQLTGIVNAVLPGCDVSLDPKMPPPDEAECRRLRKAVLVALADRIARKLPESRGDSAEEKKKLRKAYETPLLSEPVFLHPGSSMFRRQPPLIVFTEIMETSKVYLKGVVCVEGDWLARLAQSYCSLSAPQEDPPPSWDSEQGVVMCTRSGSYGRLGWPLAPTELPYPPGVEGVKWLARFLLEGAVCPLLKKFTPELLASANTVLRPWARLQPRVENLLGDLASRSVFTRADLHQQWATDPKYLLESYCKWLPESLHLDISGAWPPI